MVLLSKVLGNALLNKPITVTLKNGLIVTGTLRQMDEQHFNLILDNIDESNVKIRSLHEFPAENSDGEAAGSVLEMIEQACPPHLKCVKTLQVRGSSIRSVDFDPSLVNLNLIAKVTEME